MKRDKKQGLKIVPHKKVQECKKHHIVSSKLEHGANINEKNLIFCPVLITHSYLASQEKYAGL